MYYRKIESDKAAKAQHDENEKFKARARRDRQAAQRRVYGKAQPSYEEAHQIKAPE